MEKRGYVEEAELLLWVLEAPFYDERQHASLAHHLFKSMDVNSDGKIDLADIELYLSRANRLEKKALRTLFSRRHPLSSRTVSVDARSLQKKRRGVESPLTSSLQSTTSTRSLDVGSGGYSGALSSPHSPRRSQRLRSIRQKLSFRKYYAGTSVTPSMRAIRTSDWTARRLSEIVRDGPIVRRINGHGTDESTTCETGSQRSSSSAVTAPARLKMHMTKRERRISKTTQKSKIHQSSKVNTKPLTDCVNGASTRGTLTVVPRQSASVTRSTSDRITSPGYMAINRSTRPVRLASNSKQNRFKFLSWVLTLLCIAVAVILAGHRWGRLPYSSLHTNSTPMQNVQPTQACVPEHIIRQLLADGVLATRQVERMLSELHQP